MDADMIVVGAGVAGLQRARGTGVQSADRIPHILPPNERDRFYLETKASRSGHFIDFAGKPHLQEQGENILVEGMEEN